MLSTRLIVLGELLVAAPFGLSWAARAFEATPVERAESRQEVRRELHGYVHESAVVVPSGTDLWVSDDLVLSSDSTIVIEGTIRVMDRDPKHGAANGPVLELRAKQGVFIARGGAILGGNGRSGRAEHPAGGVGSHIVIYAPVSWIDGTVRAGDGGDALATERGCHGGSGGAVDVFGSAFTHRALSEHVPFRPDTFGIIGGDGGYPAGNGGDAMVHDDPTEVATAVVWNPLTMSVAGAALPGPIFACSDAPADGGAGSPAIGGGGGYGETGDPGSSTAPDGKPGKVGGKGGDATGGAGDPGTPGANCCAQSPNTGGTGGKGGPGGPGTGGIGGHGGLGGSGWSGGTANGGPGGPGGVGGTGTGGTRGAGGPGGPHLGTGGSKGEPGDGIPGPGGPEGIGGPGTNGGQQGPGGPLGPLGGSAGGATAPNGNTGPACPPAPRQPDGSV